MKLSNLLKLYYLTYFINIGVFFPFLNLYLRKIGLSGSQIGIITAVGLLLAAIGQPAWGFVADAFGTRKRILQLNLFLSLICILLLSFQRNFLILFALLVLFRFIRSPLMRIVDTAALDQSHISYGRMRLWGSVGFGSAVILAGNLFQKTTLDNFFYAFALVGIVCLLLSFSFPPDIKKKNRSLTKHKLSILVKDHTFLFFLVFSFLVGVPRSMNSTFFSIYLDELGAGEGLIGLAWAAASFSNIGIFFYSDRLLKKFGSTRLLIFGALLFGIRWLLYACISNPFFVLAIQPIQGASFALFYSAGVTFVSEAAPSELQVTGQGMFGAFFTFGLSGIAGSLLGGLIMDELGIWAMYGIGGVISLLAASLFFWRTTAKTSSP